MPADPAASPSCSRCRLSVGEADRFCRACGYALTARAEYAEELYRTVVETLPAGIFILDPSSRVRYWNRALEEQTGVRRRDALGRVLFDLLPHLHPHAHRMTRAAETGLPVRVEQISHASAGGAQVTESYWFGPILLEDGSGALLGVVDDITQKARVDTQLIRSERLAAIGELAAGVAHNFNNILAAIGGDAQLLRLAAEEDGLPPHVVEAAQQICDETMRGGRIAHDLLAFARGAEPRIERLDVLELLKDVARLVRNHPAARSVDLELGVEEGLPRVEADANLLHQVCFNLMLNAVQAMPQGGVLTVGAELRGDDRQPSAGVLDLKFHDTGVGISKEQLKRVFDPFYSRRASGDAGSGLGLPVSLAMVKSIGGDVQIASAEGIGTTVTVSLPIVERRSVARTGALEPVPARVLVADDDPQVRRMLTSLLTRRGFEVVTATDAEEAIARCEESAGQPFRMALTEWLLPRAEGGATLARMRDLQPETPVLVLTGATDSGALTAALEAGAAYALAKPPNFTELLAAIDRLRESRDAGSPSAAAAGHR